MSAAQVLIDPEFAHSTIYEKLFELKSRLIPVIKGKKGYNYKYADLGACHEVLDPILEDLGLLWQTSPRSEADGRVGVDYRLVDIATGSCISGNLLLPCPDGDPQKAGSAITYARRYALAAVGLLTEEDDDGAKASRGKTTKARAKPGHGNYLTDAERGQVVKRIEARAADQPDDVAKQAFTQKAGAAVVSHFGVTRFGEIPSGKLEEALEVVNGL